MKNIWMYWEGRELPEFARCCVETVRKHKGGLELHFLNEETVREYLPDLGEEWRKLKHPAHRADYVRTRLGYRYGGMWMDCDMAALGALEPLFEIPPQFDYACQSIEASIGCFVARPECGILGRVMAAQDEVLKTAGEELCWNAIGNDLLKSLSGDYPYHEWKRWTVCEIPEGKVARLLSRMATCEQFVDRNAVIFHFNGSNVLPLLETYAKHNHKNLLKSGMLIARILRRCLDLEEPTMLEQLVHFSDFRDGADAVIRKAARFSASLRAAEQ